LRKVSAFFASFEAVTGRLGVGSIAFLGLFLIVDGLQLGAFEMIESYGKSATWGIVGVVPTAVVIYIVGVFCVGLAEMIVAPFPAFRGPTPEDVFVVSRLGGPVVQQSYTEHLRNHELLKGAAVSFVILAIGSFAEFQNARGFEALAWISAAAAVALSTLSLAFSRRALLHAAHLASVVRDSDRHVGT
jgi:hypothetical protein